jgi:predicted TIM-barrel fold metal-dependent hydrolase
MMTMSPNRAVIISADGHCGARLLDYKPFLESRFHEEFDAWAATYRDAWDDVEDAFPSGMRHGFAAFDHPLNWDSAKRLMHTEEQGIAAEVLFPNTAPPFYPSNVITAPGPSTRDEYEHRFAGLRAHNRWLAEFCQDAPGRRAGFAQVFLDDVDDAVAEAHWARAAGLKGIALPADHIQKLVNLYYPRYDPFWAACAELDLPVHRHGIKFTEPADVGGPGVHWVSAFEHDFFDLRGLAHMLCSGVFEKFPNLKLVTTELPASQKVIAYLARLDAMYDERKSGHMRLGNFDIAEAVFNLSRRPSEYFASNCSVGAPLDFRAAYDAGVPNLMWGADIPHAEGTSPFSLLAIRHTMQGLSQAEVERLTSVTAALVYGFDLVELQPVADQIGPTFAELSAPVPPSELPTYPTETQSRAFAPTAA